MIAVGLLLAAASVFTFSVPGLAWFVIALPVWLALEAIAGRSPIDWRAVRDGVAAHRVTLVVAAVIVIAIAALVFGPAREFASKVGDVQNSFGRLSSPVFPGEALGIWPAGDFRIVRGEVSGALFAVAVGAIAAGFGVVSLWRRRQFARAGDAGRRRRRLPRHPRGRRDPRAGEGAGRDRPARAPRRPARPARAPSRATSDEQTTLLRYAFGVVVLVAALASTLLALRDAPIADDRRQLALERLAERARGRAASPSSASTASPATTCARPSPGPRPGTCRRRSRRGRRSDGSRATRPTSTRSTRASSTSSTTRSPPRPPTPRPRRPTSSPSRATATTCSGGARARRRAAGCSRARTAPRPRPSTATELGRRAGIATLLAADLVRPLHRLAAAAAGRARRRRPGARLRGAGRGLGDDPAARARAPTSSRSSTTRRCRSRWSSTTRWSPSCRRRSTACT